MEQPGSLSSGPAAQGRKLRQWMRKIGQGFVPVKDFLTARHSTVYFRRKTVLHGSKDSARTQPPGADCGLNVWLAWLETLSAVEIDLGLDRVL